MIEPPRSDLNLNFIYTKEFCFTLIKLSSKWVMLTHYSKKGNQEPSNRCPSFCKDSTPRFSPIVTDVS